MQTPTSTLDSKMLTNLDIIKLIAINEKAFKPTFETINFRLMH